MACWGAAAQTPTPGPVSHLYHIADVTDFITLSLPDNSRPDLGLERTSKYLAPVRRDANLLPALVQNVALFPFHFQFLINTFPERFAGMTFPEYLALIERRAMRQYYAGGLFQFRDHGTGDPIWGFSIYTQQSTAELLEPAEVDTAYRFLLEAVALRPLAYAPMTAMEINKAREWQTPPFPVYLPEGLALPTYEAYNEATNYGWVRVMTMAEFEIVERDGLLGFQDILVLDGVPFDVESIVAGVLTADRQTTLSHVNLRAVRRGTPNAFVENAHEALAAYDGQLVRLDARRDGYVIDTDVTLEQAEAYWAANRPRLRRFVYPDFESRELLDVLDMPREASVGLLVSRYGGKAANLGVMYRTLPGQHQTPAFAVPVAYYRDFMNSNFIVDTRSDPPVQVTYQQYVERLLADPAFRTDPVLRRAVLTHFRRHIRQGAWVPPSLVSRLADKIEALWGDRTTMVRFRSSSNLEDDVEFSAAGLHDSTGVCVADSFDGNNSGPSHCNPEQSSERTIERGLRVVWAGLWNVRAFEEREYYQVPHEHAAMGILVSTAYPDEDADGVAFTGDPSGSNPSYLINVNPGDYSVARPELGILPERNLLEMDACQVSRIIRVRGASLLEPGEWVLDEAQLHLLGRQMCEVKQVYPFNFQGHAPHDVLLDFEFKFDQGELIFKQTRPFLVASARLLGPEAYQRLDVPQPIILVRAAWPGESVREVFHNQARVTLREGSFYLPRGEAHSEVDLVERVELRTAPAQPGEVAAPHSRGLVALSVEHATNETQYTHEVSQHFQLHGATHTLTLPPLRHALPDGTTQTAPINLRPNMLGQARLNAALLRPIQSTGSLIVTTLTMENGSVITLHERDQLTRAMLTWDDGSQTVSNIWRLALARPAPRTHAYLFVLNTPMGAAHAVEVEISLDSGHAQAYLLDAGLVRLETLVVSSFERGMTPHAGLRLY